MNHDIEQLLNEYIDSAMEQYDLPGLAIGISSGNACFTAARGYSRMSDTATANASVKDSSHVPATGSASGIPLQPKDIFHCASVSKLFTSSAIMKLVEAGAFGLYDRLCDILPGLHIADKRFSEIRLWNMLTHTSGLGDVNDYLWHIPETDEDSLRRYVYSSPEVIDQPMLWWPKCSPEFYGVHDTDEYGNPLLDETGKPKKLFRYSNVAYEILGQIVAEYSDRMPNARGKLSYEDFVAEYLLKPAGMTSSTMKTFERCSYNDAVSRSGCSMVSPYAKATDRSIVPVEFYPYTRQHGPSSTLTSNLTDLLRWGRAHMNGVILQRETYDSIWRDYATVPNNGEKMGLGWFMRCQKVNVDGTGSDNKIGDRVNCCQTNVQSFRLFGHEGTDDGFRASFWICPELDLVTVVLSNLSGAPVKKINKKLFERLAKSAI